MQETEQLNWLEFVNEGEVPVNAFKLLGASTKRGVDGKIGYFGSGLKYSLAVLLREGVSFRIFSGEKEIKVGTRKTKFAEKNIDVITINGEKTSITLDAGVDWELWFALREIYSNTLDENGKMYARTENSPQPESGRTKIFICIDDALKEIMDNWSEYFSNTRKPLFENDCYRILEKNNSNSLTIFRRGIRAYTNRKESIFDYDIDKLEINESRVAKYDFRARQSCAEALACCDNEEVIKKFIIANNDKYTEKEGDFWTYLFDSWDSHHSFSDTWLKILEDKRIVPYEYGGFYGITSNTVLLPEKLCKHLYKKFGDKLQVLGLSKEQYIILEKKSTKLIEPYMRRLDKVGFGFPMKDVRWARFKDKNVLGQFDKGLVLISEQLSSPISETDLLKVLFEEVAHAKSGYSDNTRHFQDYLIAISCSLLTYITDNDKKFIEKV